MKLRPQVRFHRSPSRIQRLLKRRLQVEVLEDRVVPSSNWLLTGITPVTPNPRTTSVPFVDVSFTKPIKPATINSQDLSLTLNNGANLITAATPLTVTPLGGTTYRIGGLGALTITSGYYTLTVDATGIQDALGGQGTGSASVAWVNNSVPMSQSTRDLFAFRSPADAPATPNFGNTVLALTMSQFTGAQTSFLFDASHSYDLNVVNTSGHLTPDLTFRATFAPPVPAGSDFNQVVTLRLIQGNTTTTIAQYTYVTNQVIPPAAFANNITFPGDAIATGRFIVGQFDDPSFLDLVGIDNWLQTGGPASGRGFPSPSGQATNFYGPSANVLGFLLEVPTTKLTTANPPRLGFWATHQVNGTQVDRVGRPMIDNLLLPPVPRSDLSRGDRRTAFEQGSPLADSVNFTGDLTAVLTKPIASGGVYGLSSGQASALINSTFGPTIVGSQTGLLPNILTFDASQLYTGQGFPNGRRFRDDATSSLLNLLTAGAVTTDNVADDNGARITDGNFGTSVQFPYIGRPNNPPAGPQGVTLGGSVSGQLVTDFATVQPFSTFTVSNSASPAAILTMTILLSPAANGAFTAASLAASGFTSTASGVFTFRGTATAAQAAIRSLVFAPVLHEVPPGLSATTLFTVVVDDGQLPFAVDDMTSVVAFGTTPPSSSVNALPAVTNTPSFTVSWSGTPGTDASSITSFDVFVSDNGGPFMAFQSATAQTSATFNGRAGHTYGFYSVATDNLGDRQPTPTAAQVTTTVADVTAPTWPAGSVLTVSNLLPTSLTLTWGTAQDDVAVTGYRLFQETTPLADVGANIHSFSVTGLTPLGPSHHFHVEAFDAAGNISNTGPSVTVTTPDVQTAYVTALYKLVLGRVPDAPGLSSWVHALQTGASFQQVTAGFWEAPEHRGIQVDGFYGLFLHRPADAAGRAGWVNALLSGMTDSAVEHNFLLSSEFQAAHPDVLSNVQALYQDVLGRPADPTAIMLAQSLEPMPSGRAMLADTVLNSSEEQRRIVDGFYASFLGRAPDTVGEQAWVQALLSSTLTHDKVAEAFLASQEFFTRTQTTAF